MHLPVSSICEFPSLIICTYCSLEIPHDNIAFFFYHSQKKQCQLQVNAASTHSTTSKKAQISEEPNSRESEGRSTSQNDLALWAKTKFCLDAPPSQPLMSRILSASSTLGLERKEMSKRNRRGKMLALKRS